MKIEEISQLPVGGMAIVAKRGHQICIQRTHPTVLSVEIKDAVGHVILYVVCEALFFEDLLNSKNKQSEDTSASSVS